MPIDSDRNPKINRRKAKKIIDKSGINENLKEVKELHRGWNTIYKLETYNQKYCIRIFTNDFGRCGEDWKADKEHYIHGKMQKNDVKSPESLFKDTSRSIIDYEYVILGFEEGLTLKDISNPLTDKQDYLEILENIGEQMALIHQASMPKLSKYHFRLNQDFTSIREGIKHHLEYCPDEETRQKILNKVNDLEQELSSSPELVPVHTEITDRNVLVSNNENKWELSSIIDVEWSMKALPEREFARPTFEMLYYQNDEKQFQTRLKHLLKGYYNKGGELRNPEAIPLMIIHHLLWGSREHPERNLPKIKKNLETGEDIVNQYNNVIEDLI